MAREFSSSVPYQWLEQSTGLGITARDFSVSMWVSPHETNRQTLFWIGDSTSKKRHDVLQIQAQSHIGVWSQYDNKSREAITAGTMSIGGIYHVFGIFDDSTNTNTAYFNGIDKATKTVVLDGTPNYDFCSIAMSRDASPSHPYDGIIGEVCVWDSVDWTDDEVYSMVEGYSPWFFKPEKIIAYWRLWRDNNNNLFEFYDFTPINSPTNADHFPILYPGYPPFIGGGPLAITTNFEYTATGGLTIEGTSDADWGTSYVADADNAIGGSADASQPIFYEGDAALNLDGTSDADWGTTYIVEAGFIIGGTGELDVGKEYIGDSSLTLSGTSPVDWGTTYLVYDGLILGGTSDADWGTTYVVYVGLTVTGEVPPDWASHYEFSGGLILGFNAQTQIDWVTHFAVIGGVTLGFLAYTTYDWGTTYLVYGGLVFDGTAGGSGWRVDYYPVPGLNIDGSSPIYLSMLYGGDANLYIGCDYNLVDYGYFTISDEEAFRSGWVTISSDNLSIDISNLYGDERGLAYYDHLPSYDELFVHKFDFYKDLANSDTNSWTSIWGMTNTIDGLGNLLFSNAQAVGIRHYQNAIRLVNYESGELSTNLVLADERYYVTVDRAVAGTIKMYIYSDSARTSLYGQRSISIVPARTFQYIMGFNNHENAFSSAYRWSGNLSNLQVEHFGYEHRDFRCYSPDVDWGTSYIPTGGLTCSGAAENELCLYYAEDANLYLNGTSDADWGTTYWVYGDQLVLNGTSDADWSTTYIVYAGLIIGGSGEYTLPGSYEPVGGLLLGGTSPVAWGTTYIVIEGLTISGDGGISQGVGYDGDASLIIDGTSDADWGTTYIVLAGLIIDGSGGHTGGLGMDYDGDVSLVINGTSDADWGTTYIVYVGLLVSGETPPDWSTHYDFSGGLIIGISAQTQIDWSTHYQWEGGLVIGFNAVTTYDWGTTYVVEAGLIIGGAGDIGQGMGYDDDASLIIGGTSDADWGTTYIVYVGLVVAGETPPDWASHYDFSGGLIIGISAQTQIDWATHYNWEGGLVIGFNAVTTYDWGTTYIVEAGLIVGGSAGGTDNGLGIGYGGDASLIIGGTSDADWGATYIVEADLVIGGSAGGAENGLGLGYDGDASLIISGTFPVDWGTTYIVYAGLVVGGEAGGAGDGLGLGYDGDASLITGGTSPADWGTTYIVYVGLVIGGSGDTSIPGEYVPVGGLVLNGTSDADWGTTYIVEVGLIVGGSSGPEYGADFEFTGGLIIGIGSFATYDWGTTYIVQVGLIVGGSSGPEYGADFEFIGGLIIGIGSLTTYDWGTTYIVEADLILTGTTQPDYGAEYTYVSSLIIGIDANADADWGTTYIVDVGLLIQDTAQPDWVTHYEFVGAALTVTGTQTALVSWGTTYIVRDGPYLILNGTSDADWGTTYIVQVGLVVSGETPPDWASGYQWSGGLIIGISADTQIDWSTHYNWEGGLVIGFNAVTTYDWGTTYIVEAGLTIGGTIDPEDGLGIGYGGDASLIIGGTSPAAWGTTYIVYVGLVIGGSIEAPSEDHEYEGTAGLIIGGTSPADWGTSYIPTDGLYLCGDQEPGEDFCTGGYIEIDDYGAIDIDCDRIWITDLPRSNMLQYDHRVYVDKGVGHFGSSFTHSFALHIDPTADTNSFMGLWGVSNEVDRLQLFTVNDSEALSIYYFNGKLNLENYEKVPQVRVSSTDIAKGITFYLTVTKSGTSVVADIFDSPGRTNLVSTISTTVSAGRSYRYYLPVNNADVRPYPEEHPFTGWVSAVNLNDGTFRRACGIVDADWGTSDSSDGGLVFGAGLTIGSSSYFVVSDGGLLLGGSSSSEVVSDVGLILGGTSPFTVHYDYVANYIFEDFTGYIIDDPHGVFKIRSEQIFVDGIYADQRAMAYTPQGKKIIDRFTHTFRAITYSDSHPQAVMSWWAVSQEVLDMAGWEASDENALSVGWDAGRIYLKNFATGEADYFPANEDQWYRIIVKRRQVTNELDAVTAELYTDAGAHLHTLYVGDDTLKVYSNIFAVNSPNSLSLSLFAVSSLATEHVYVGAVYNYELQQEGRSFDLWGRSSYRSSAYTYYSIGKIQIEAKAPSAIVGASHYVYEIPAELILGGTGLDPYAPVGGLVIEDELQPQPPPPPITDVVVTYTLGPLFTWNIEEALDAEHMFLWNFDGGCEKHWYRVEGLCAESSCETTGVETGEDCPVMYFQYFLSCNLDDLARQIRESGLKWPISGITRASSTWTGEPDACERFTDVPWEDYPGFEEFTLLAGLYVPNVHIGAITYNSEMLRAVDGTGGLTLGGKSIIEPIRSVGQLEIGGASLVESSDSILDGGGFRDFGTLSVDMGMNITTEYEQYTWVDPLAGTIDILPTNTIPTDCVVPILPHVIHMSHTLDRNNVLADFLLRNNITMPNVEMRYRPFNRTWQGNLHYSGYGQMASDDEKWALIFEWSCGSEVSDVTLSGSVWTYAITIVRELATAGSSGYIITPAMRRLDSTKIVLAFDPRNSFSNETLDVAFTLNTLSGVVIADPYTITVVNILNDGIGLFSDARWNDDPDLRIHVTSLVPRQSQEWYDITPIIPQEDSIFETV